MESKKINDPLNISKGDLEKKLVVIRWEKEEWRGKIELGDKDVQNMIYKINMLQGYIIQNGEYRQYLIITLSVT